MASLLFATLVVASEPESRWIPAHLHTISGRPSSPQSQPGLKPADANANSKAERGGMYRGQGDRLHLGGFTDVDIDGLSPAAWRYMMQNLTVKSLIDVGCGMGVSTSWFAAHGTDVLCVEGSSDAVAHSRLPREKIVEHDFSRGEWWPNITYDAVWSVEFIEHVGRQYMHHYLPIFESAALVFVSGSSWGGWHHVEVHEEAWWRARFEGAGLVYSEALTSAVRKQALLGTDERSNDGVQYRAQHVWLHMQVYLNPPVLRLRKHAHLIGGPGCFNRMSPTVTAHNSWCGVERSMRAHNGVSKKDKLSSRWHPLRGAFLSDEEVGWAPPTKIPAL